MRFDKGGQLGKIISTFPVMLLIFLIIIVYLVLAVFAFGVKGEKVPVSIEKVNLDNLLLKEIEINGEKITVLDALIKFEKREIEKADIIKEVEKFENKEEYILLLAKGESQYPGNMLGGTGMNNIVIKFKDGEFSSPNSASHQSYFSNYRKAGLSKQISFDIKGINEKNRLYVEYYYGGVLK